MKSCALVLLLATVISLGAGRARACSYVPIALYQSDPRQGATGVPLNQALAIEGAFIASSVRLENERGEAVPFELNAGPWPGFEGTSADVIPREPLQPNTRYRLRVDAMFPDAEAPLQPTATLEFTTGTTSLPEVTLSVPTLKATVVRDNPPPMCGTGNQLACIGTADTAGVELIMRRGDTVLLRTTTLVSDSGTYALPEVPDCIELRRRAPTGKRSEPFKLCGDALRVHAWTEEDNGEFGFLDCMSGETPTTLKASNTNDGCAVGATREASWLLAALALCLTRRRRT